VLEAHDPLGLGHLEAAQPRDVPLGMGTLGQGLVEDAAAFAAGAAHHHDLDATVEIVGVRCRTLARFVVGVRVHGHQAQRHRSRLLSFAD
jgi:hypothetical protein